MAICAIPNQARNAPNRAAGVNTPTETTATATSSADTCTAGDFVTDTNCCSNWHRAVGIWVYGNDMADAWTH